MPLVSERQSRRPGGRIAMKFISIVLVLCACMCLASSDVIHLKGAKAKLISSLVNKAKHHKRGILSSVPTFKLGHDIPLVSHSVVKPFVVNYPPTATVASVKVPLTHPLLQRYPLPVGHRVPVPHPHYGLNFPHSTKSVVVSKPDHHFHHHHHHVSPRPVVPIVPVAPAPVPIPAPAPVPVPAPAAIPIPVPATPSGPFVPIAQPTTAVAHPASVPPVFIHSAPAVPAPAVTVAQPPLPILPQNHLNFKPLLSAAVPIQPASVIPAPLFQYAQQFPYVLRHGGAVQTSVFATYPRFPLVHYQPPLIPIGSLAPSNGQILLNRPQVLLQRPQVILGRPQVPQFHLVPQPGIQGGVVEHAHTNVAVEPTPTLLHPTQAALPTPNIHVQPAAIPQPAVHLQPTQPSVNLEHDGWSPVTTQSHDLVPAQSPEVHYPQPQPHHHFTQQQGTQVYEHHTGEGTYDLHHQLQHHIQQQIEQAQHEQHYNNQQHQFATTQQPGQEYGVPQQDFSQENHDYAYHGQEYAPHDQQYFPNDQQFIQNTQNFGQPDQQYIPQDQQFPQQEQQFGQHDQQFAQHDQQFAQHDQQFAQHDQQFAQHNQQFSHHDQQFSQQEQQFTQHDQQFGQNDQHFSQQDQQFGQQDQQFGQHGQGFDLGQPVQEYGLPQQGLEGRNDEDQANDQQFHNHIPLGLQPPINEPLDHFR